MARTVKTGRMGRTVSMGRLVFRELKEGRGHRGYKDLRETQD